MLWERKVLLWKYRLFLAHGTIEKIMTERKPSEKHSQTRAQILTCFQGKGYRFRRWKYFKIGFHTNLQKQFVCIHTRACVCVCLFVFYFGSMYSSKQFWLNKTDKDCPFCFTVFSQFSKLLCIWIEIVHKLCEVHVYAAVLFKYIRSSQSFSRTMLFLCGRQDSVF